MNPAAAGHEGAIDDEAGLLGPEVREGFGEQVDVMRRDFIRALRASGVSEWSVVLKHGLRNAALPVVTSLGFIMITAMASAVFVERAFVLPGLGSLAVGAADQGDVRLMLGLMKAKLEAAKHVKEIKEIEKSVTEKIKAKEKNNRYLFLIK